MGVSLKFTIDAGEVKFRSQRQKKLVNLASSDHKTFVLLAVFQAFGQTVADDDAGNKQAAVSSED